jgi:hypothetical protein
MLVTPEVSQLEMSSLNTVLGQLSVFVATVLKHSSKRLSMFVIPEISQWEMGPYVSIALAVLLVYSESADFKEGVSVKAQGGGEGGGGEGGGAGGGDGGGGEGGGEGGGGSGASSGG